MLLAHPCRCPAPRSRLVTPSPVGSVHAHAWVCKPKHGCTHTHVISQPPPPPLRDHLPADSHARSGCVTHVGPVLRVWRSWRWAGMVVFAPFGPCAWLGAGTAAHGVLQRWEQGRAGGTAPSHSDSIRVAVLARGETPGRLYLLVVVSPLPRQFRIPSAVGRIGSAAGQHCSSACKPGSWGHCREIPPLQVLASPSVGQILTSLWGEVGRRGRIGAGLMEKSQKRGVNPSSQHASLPSSCMGASAFPACWQHLPAEPRGSEPIPSDPVAQQGSPGGSRAAGVGACCIPQK